jgi:hypothetical protein
MEEIYGYFEPKKWQVLKEKKYVPEIKKFGDKTALLCLIGIRIDKNNNKFDITKYIPKTIYEKLINGNYVLSTAGFEEGLFVFDENGDIVDDIPMWYDTPKWLADTNLNDLSLPILN